MFTLHVDLQNGEIITVSGLENIVPVLDEIQKQIAVLELTATNMIMYDQLVEIFQGRPGVEFHDEDTDEIEIEPEWDYEHGDFREDDKP